MCFEKKYICKNKSILFKKNFFLMKKITPTKLKNKNINSISIYKNIMFNLIKKTTIFLISSNKEYKNIKFSKIFSLLFLTIFKIIFLKKNNLKLMMNFKKKTLKKIKIKKFIYKKYKKRYKKKRNLPKKIRRFFYRKLKRLKKKKVFFRKLTKNKFSKKHYKYLNVNFFIKNMLILKKKSIKISTKNKNNFSKISKRLPNLKYNLIALDNKNELIPTLGIFEYIVEKKIFCFWGDFFKKNFLKNLNFINLSNKNIFKKKNLKKKYNSKKKKSRIMLLSKSKMYFKKYKKLVLKKRYFLKGCFYKIKKKIKKIKNYGSIKWFLFNCLNFFKNKKKLNQKINGYSLLTHVNRGLLVALRKRIKQIFTPKFYKFIQTYIVSFFESFFKKKIFLNVQTKYIIKKKISKKIKALSKKYKSHQTRIGRGFFLSEMVEILYIAFIKKDVNILSDWLKKVMEKIQFRNHKKFLNFFKILITSNYKFLLSNNNVKGFFFDIRGKVGVSGNAKKRHFSFYAGSYSKTTKFSKFDYNHNMVRTFTGALGCTFIIFY